MALDLSRDYLIVDDPEAVTYYPKLGEGRCGPGVAVDYVQLTQVTREDVARTPALLDGETCVFHLWRARMGALQPRLGDRIVDARGAGWIVHAVTRCDRDANGYQRYRLAAVGEH